jgi:hypothetical protein
MEPKHGGSIPSAEREEDARELIWRANSELVERLLSIMNDKDDPGLSAIDNKRRRYARILWAIAAYFDKLGHDKLPGLGTYIAGLGVALEDLIRGVTDPLFVTKGSKRDSMRTWGARLQAVRSPPTYSSATRRQLSGRCARRPAPFRSSWRRSMIPLSKASFRAWRIRAGTSLASRSSISKW